MTMPYLGTVPGAGGSFPMAGVRPKVKKTVVISTSRIWVAPSNVNEVYITMCAGGGGGGGGGAASAGYGAGLDDQGTHFTAGGGGGGGAGGNALVTIPIPVLPNYAYTVTIGAGGLGGAPSTGTGSAGSGGTTGGATSFVGGIISMYVSGGNAGGAGTYTSAGGVSTPSSAPSIAYLPWANKATTIPPGSTVTNSSQGIHWQGGSGRGGQNGITANQGTNASTGTAGDDILFTRGGSGGGARGGGRVGPAGGGGGASLYGRGGQGASGAIFKTSGQSFNNSDIISASIAGQSGSQSQQGYPAFGGGGGGGSGGFSMEDYSTVGGRNFKFQVTGSSGGDGEPGVVILEWEE